MGMRISSAGIAGLGNELGNIADYLEARAADTRDSTTETYGFVDQSAIGAYDSMLGDYELVRKAMCKELRRLRDLARDAGACYVETEDVIDQRNRTLL